MNYLANTIDNFYKLANSMDEKRQELISNTIGPGETWGDVQQDMARSKYTMMPEALSNSLLTSQDLCIDVYNQIKYLSKNLAKIDLGEHKYPLTEGTTIYSTIGEVQEYLSRASLKLELLRKFI